jgi:hypothetical protein
MNITDFRFCGPGFGAARNQDNERHDRSGDNLAGKSQRNERASKQREQLSERCASMGKLSRRTRIYLYGSEYTLWT